MTLDYLISVPKVDDPGVLTGAMHLVGEYGDNLVYDMRSQDDPMLWPEFATSTLIGSWDFEGVLQGVLDPDYFVIRPIGNDDGLATSELQYSYGFGWKQRQLQDVPALNTTALYPADNQPIILTMASRWDDTAGFEGWGWIATIEFADPKRPPDARAIGIYDDAWGYLYTTGAFVWTDTGELDAEGDSIFKWQTVNPAGRVTVDPEPFNYALLFGSAQEGRMRLETESRTDYFWEKNQIPLNPEWVDSGVTVTGMEGTATGVTDTSPFLTGQPVRIDGVEFTITTIGGGWIALDPYAISPTGAAVEVLGSPVTKDTIQITHDSEVVFHG